MSYQESKNITSIFSAAVLLAVYCVYSWNKFTAGTIAVDNLREWSRVILVFVAISVAVMIAIQIIFHILFSIGVAVREKMHNPEKTDKSIEHAITREMVEDERGKLIELKSVRWGFVLVGTAFGLSLVLLALGQPALLMLHILFISFNLATVLEGVVQLFYYRRGL